MGEQQEAASSSQSPVAERLRGFSFCGGIPSAFEVYALLYAADMITTITRANNMMWDILLAIEG